MLIKTSESKESDICHYCFFLKQRDQISTKCLNGYHALLMMSMNLSDVAVLNIRGADYGCFISGISKS